MSIPASAHPIQVTCVETGSRRDVKYRVDGHSVFISANDDVLRRSGEAEVALGLLPALKSGRDLAIDLPISPRLADDVHRLQDIFGMWFGRPPIAVTAATTGEQEPDAPGATGCFFSGGADSFYSAILHEHEIDYLVFVHGFDIFIEDEALGAKALDHARKAATDLGKPLIEIRTDLRNYRLMSDDWGMTHGAALAFVAHSLGGRVGRVFIPSSDTYNELSPWGSHPLTDLLWNGPLTLIHDGAGKTRMQKLAYLAGNPVAQAHLRVCWENRAGRYNCCRCEKCTRTMAALRSVGALDKFRTFDRSLNLNWVRFGPIPEDGKPHWRQILAQAKAADDGDLVSAVQWRLRVGPLRESVRANGYALYKKSLQLIKSKK